MTKARIQPFCRANIINLGYFDATRVFPRSVTDRDNALFLYSNVFCSIWKSENINFNKSIKELKDNFKIVDNYITKESVQSHFEYNYKPRRTEPHLTIFFTNVLETHNTDRARPYVFCFYRLSKISVRYDSDQTHKELDKCINDTTAFAGDGCNETALDCCLKSKREEREENNGKVLE